MARIHAFLLLLLPLLLQLPPPLFMKYPFRVDAQNQPLSPAKRRQQQHQQKQPVVRVKGWRKSCYITAAAAAAAQRPCARVCVCARLVLVSVASTTCSTSSGGGDSLNSISEGKKEGKRLPMTHACSTRSTVLSFSLRSPSLSLSLFVSHSHKQCQTLLPPPVYINKGTRSLTRTRRPFQWTALCLSLPLIRLVCRLRD